MNIRSLFACVLLAGLVAACGADGIQVDGGGTSGTGITRGSMDLKITDAPVDRAAAVVVVFEGVEILQKGKPPRLFMFDSPRAIDLLALHGGNTEHLLQGVQLPAGTYSGVRLLVNAGAQGSASYISFDDGSEYPLVIPSGSETGLKLIGEMVVPANGRADFTIDFDLRKSIATTPGADGSYILRPSLRLVNSARAGSIAGTVSASLATQPGCSGAVYVFAGRGALPDDVGTRGEPVASALVRFEATGEFRYTAAFLEPGGYTVAFTCDAAADEAAVDDAIGFEPAADVSVTAGETAIVNFGN